MGVIASRYNKHDDDGSSKQQHPFAATRRRSSSSIIRRNNNDNSSIGSKMSSLNRSKNDPSLKSDNTHQATLVSREDVTVQSKNKRIPLENISNDDAMEAEVEPKTRKEKSSRGRKTVLSPNKGSNLPSFLRGGSSKCSISKEEEIDVATAAATAAPPSKMESKQPIDPPGALWNPSGGNHHPPSFQPVGFSMPLWQPSHQDDSSGRSWAVPPFLAPLTATVRHPFSHFVPNGHGHFPYWQQQQQHQGMNIGEEFGIPMEAEMEAAGDTNMKDDDCASIESKGASNKVDIPDIPSTFAPQECVDKIRAKATAGKVPHVIQTRSMTAKSRSTKKSSKQKVAPIAAHQASSPPSTKGNLLSTVDETPVEVLTILGKTVHMIDPDRKVFVIDLLSPETCDEIRMMADNHTRNAKKDDEVWRTLYTYTKMDLPVVEGKVNKLCFVH
eukprot:scaffold583_cov154-Skeletonema_menzelii.AAC.4